jgi:hypothetical protein
MTSALLREAHESRYSGLRSFHRTTTTTTMSAADTWLPR